MTILDLTNLDNSGWLFQNFKLMVIFDESSVIIMIISDDIVLIRPTTDDGRRAEGKDGRAADVRGGSWGCSPILFFIFGFFCCNIDHKICWFLYFVFTLSQFWSIDWLDLLSAQILMITSRCAVHLSIYHHHHLTIYKITTPSKVCTYLLIFASIFLVIVTLPLSLCLIIKVNSLVRTSPRSIPTATRSKVVQDYERVVIFRLGRILGGGARCLSPSWLEFFVLL